MRIPIDSGEIQYDFKVLVRDTAAVIEAEFRGPQLGTAFQMELKDARQMRADLDAAIKNAEQRRCRR